MEESLKSLFLCKLKTPITFVYDFVYDQNTQIIPIIIMI